MLLLLVPYCLLRTATARLRLRPKNSMKTFIRLFQPRFAPLVESGQKTQTVRKTPKRMPKVGDLISLRTWTGKPYRSKQRVLRESTIIRVAQVFIGLKTVNVGGKGLDLIDIIDFAKRDGFDGIHDMLEWFKNNHDLPFTGILIQWE